MNRAEHLNALRGAWAGIITAKTAIDGATEPDNVDVQAALRVLSEAAQAVEAATVALSGDNSMFASSGESPPSGQAALEALLATAWWPEGTSIAAAQAAAEDALLDLGTRAGRERPSSIWRALLVQKAAAFDAAQAAA